MRSSFYYARTSLIMLLSSFCANSLFAITISPTQVTLQENGDQQFTASRAATWRTDCGTISSTGLFKAKLYPKLCTITAIANDGSGSVSTSVNVVSPITITPVAPRTPQGGTQQFTASVPVTWTARCGVISASGLFSANAAVGSNCTVQATAANGMPYTAYGYDTVTAPPTANGVSIIPKVGGLAFYHQIVHTKSSPLPITITNNQSSAVNVSSITSTLDFPFTSTCSGGSLAPHTSCTIGVSFDPQVIGDRLATLNITESTHSAPIIVPLKGTGIAGDPGLTVTVKPNAPCTLPSQKQQFTAAVTGTTDTAVTWYVDGLPNGDAAVGTISDSGLYTAPTSQGTHTVKGVSRVASAISGHTAITITRSPNFAIYPFTSSIPTSGKQAFQPQICYVPDAGRVSWSVDNVVGGNSTVGTVTSAGVYTAPLRGGQHTVRVTDLTLNKTSGAIVTVFSAISVDFGSRTNKSHRIPADIFGAGRSEAIRTTADRRLIRQAGITVARLYGNIQTVYATPTPNWSKIDPLIASIQAAGQHVMLQLSYSPPWLQPSPNPCGEGNMNVGPTDVHKWAQIAASYIAHMDAVFPGVVTDYEIWNEPNTGGLCASDRLNTYMSIYAAAAPLMKQQAATRGIAIRLGGPVLSSDSGTWLSTLLSRSSTAPYVDFVSYHQYMFGQTTLQVKWDSYNGNTSMYQQTQDPNRGPAAVYKSVYAQVAAGKQPLGANTPIYITEFNTNWAFYQECCRNDPIYAPLWNALYISDVLNTVYSGFPTVAKLVYFASSAYPYFCLIGTRDQNMDCSYSLGSTPQPYPQYYTFQLLSSSNYLDLENGGYMATSINPPSGAGGLVVTAFYNASQDAIVITNPTGTAYSQLRVDMQNVGFGLPRAVVHRIISGTAIDSSSLGLRQQGAVYTANLDVPAHSVQAISLK